MKRCPSCKRTFADASLNYCLEDGTPLVSETSPSASANATNRDSSPQRTYSAPTEVYPPQQTPLLNQVEPASQPRQWPPLPPTQPRKKSSAIWWVLGGVLVLGVIVVGVAIMILALASLGSNSNENANRNTNVRNANARANRNANSNTANVNSATNLPVAITDDFSEDKWGTGNFAYGDIAYENDEYHMNSKDKSYLVMYAPNNDYNTENAIVRVTARSVDGTPASSGFGLIVHGQKSKSGEIEDYALLIYNGSDPQYEIIKHKDGTQTSVVPWTRSRVIRSGSNPNQLEVRTRGAELTFYINGQYVDRITDSENFRRGVAGFYTSGTSVIAFDDLEIRRN